MAKPDNKGTYSFQDWLTWEGTWELINGKAYSTSPAPTSLHQFIVGELHFSLRTFFRIGNVSYLLPPLTCISARMNSMTYLIMLFIRIYRWFVANTK